MRLLDGAEVQLRALHVGHEEAHGHLAPAPCAAPMNHSFTSTEAQLKPVGLYRKGIEFQEDPG